MFPTQRNVELELLELEFYELEIEIRRKSTL